MSEIILFGATGFTGQLIAEALHARGLPFAIAGRNAARLEALAARVGSPPTSPSRFAAATPSTRSASATPSTAAGSARERR